APGHSVELPLFGVAVADDTPLITKPSPPRPPLSVRRSTPDLPRRRHVQPRPETFEFDGESPAGESAPLSVSEAPAPDRGSVPPSSAADAPIGARLAAVAIDLGILAAVDAAVIYFTMQICGVTSAEFVLIPKIPLAVFLLGQNAWYLVAFT